MLAYHFDRPLADVTDSVRYRREAWYPSMWGLQYPQYAHVGRFTTPRIEVRTLFDAHGDTLKSPWTMNGVHAREPEKAGLGDALFEGSSPVIAQWAAGEVDAWLRRPPEARVGLTLARSGEEVRTTVHVDSLLGARRRLALRVLLFEDSVRMLGGTNRRSYTNVFRHAASTDGFSLGLPIPADGESTTRWTFDLAAIQRAFLVGRDVEKAAPFIESKVTPQVVKYSQEWNDRFPDLRDWTMRPAHLHVVAFVQDLETGEILQGAELKVPPAGTRRTIVR